MGKVELYQLENPSPFRKVAMGTWRTAKDPSVYSLVEIDMTATLELLPVYAQKHGVKISPSHLVGKAAAYCLKRRPEINGMIRFSKIYLRKNVDIFYQVNIPGEGPDKVSKATLSGTVVHNCDQLTLAEIAGKLGEQANKIREGKDKEIANSMNTIKMLPWWLSGWYLDIGSFLLYTLNLDLSLFGLPKDPFGSLMITNIGSLGIDLAWAPLCPYSKVPLLLTVGAIKEKPVVINGQVVARPILPVAVTFDHRFIDGIHASQMATDFKQCFAEPEKYLFAES